MNDDTSQEEIITSIISNNNSNSEEKIKPKIRHSNVEKGSSNWIVEISAKALKKLEPNKITIGWQWIIFKE